MASSDDPSPRLGVAVDRLEEALSSLDAPAPEAVTRALKALRREIALAERASRSRRSADLRGALDDADRRAADQELFAERRASAEKIGRLEDEVEALLAPTRDAARAHYRARAGALDDALATAKGRRAELETQLARASSEMERARGATAVTAAHDAEQTLAAEASDVQRKLAALGPG